eukprot:2668751-Pyramimonas_sp.AAC.1
MRLKHSLVAGAEATTSHEGELGATLQIGTLATDAVAGSAGRVCSCPPALAALPVEPEGAELLTPSSEKSGFETKCELKQRTRE